MIRTLRCPLGLIVTVLLLGVPSSPAAAARKILISDSRTTVFAVEIPGRAGYRLQADAPRGAIWIAIDALQSVIESSGAEPIGHKLLPGDTGRLARGAVQDFRNFDKQSVRLVVVEVKSAINDLAGLTFDLSGGQILEGASKANDTLLIAVTNLKLQDVLNLEEDEGRLWRPSKPVVISLWPGNVTWIRAGMHRLTNLLTTPVKFVTIEW